MANFTGNIYPFVCQEQDNQVPIREPVTTRSEPSEENCVENVIRAVFRKLKVDVNIFAGFFASSVSDVILILLNHFGRNSLLLISLEGRVDFRVFGNTANVHSEHCFNICMFSF